MNQQLFETLLNEEEGATLDFKRAQYAFSKAPENARAELVKDILGFANAWRRTDAYILIGVKEVVGGKSQVVGIAENDQLQDHALQQFINNLTNKPLRFGYEAFTYEDKPVGIIKIEPQERPIYLKKDFGFLKKENVYIRRGSCTDPNKAASPDEIAQMGSANYEPSCGLSLEFAHPEKENLLGKTFKATTEILTLPHKEDIPDFNPPQKQLTGFNSLAISNFSPFREYPNREYYRQRARYEFEHHAFRSVRFAISNVGQVAAKNVEVDLAAPKSQGLLIIGRDQLEKRPVPYEVPYPVPPILQPHQSYFDNNGSPLISENEKHYLVQIVCGDLQPGRKLYSGGVMLGAVETGTISLSGEVFADNLPTPGRFSLQISFNVSQRKLSLEDLLAL